MDDVLQGLTNVDFAERNLGVVGSAGNERLLDAIDQDFASGAGSAGLTAVLARMGIKYVLVRNDLTGSQLTGTSLARVQDTIATSPGLTLAARFGPQVPDDAPQDVLADIFTKYPAVEVYQVSGAQAAAVVAPAAGTLRVTGAPESLITLANEGLLGTSPVLLNNDGTGDPVAGTVVTDSLRRRVVNFGQLRTNYSPTLTATEPADTFLSIDDYTEPGWSADQSVAQYSGISDVTASSSASDLQASASQWASGLFPYSAFDGNPGTMWESGADDGPLGQWIQASFGSAIGFGQGDGATIGVAFANSPDVGPPVTRVTVSTAAGQVSDPVRVTGGVQSLRVPAGPSRWLRITVTGLAPLSAASLAGTQVGIATIDVPGLSAGRTIMAPPVPSGEAATVVLAKAQPYQSSCELAARWVCSPGFSSPTEEQYGFDEAVTEPSAEQAVGVRGTAVLTQSALIGKYALSGPGQPVVTASSTGIDAPQDEPWNAFDGNPATSWEASPADPHPTLSINWRSPRTISQIAIERPPGATGLAQVLITGSGGQRRGAMIGTSGRVRFAPMTTTSLTLTFTTDQAPVQVRDVTIPGVAFLSAALSATRQISLTCGQGPRLSVGGVSVRTEVTATSEDLLTGQPVSFQACDPVLLPAGTTAVTESANDAFDVQDVVLNPAGTAGTAAPGTAAAATPTAAAVVSWGSSHRAVRVAAATRSYLEVNENFNAGWQAVIGGRTLQPVQLDGWKQAWVLPAGTFGVVTLTYQPAATYRDAIVAGLAALLLCLAVGLLPAGGAALPWTPGQRRPGTPQDRRRWRRWAVVAAVAAGLAAAGLVLGGYPGAVLLPVATGLLRLRWRRRRRGRHGRDERDGTASGRPLLLGGLLAVASALGAVGEHLVYSGSSGLAVTATADAIPQVICLLVVAGLAAVCLGPPGGNCLERET
jgi:arabinofuranan 3-O-arabinosyltransferase